MGTAGDAYLGVFGPPTDKKGLCVWAGEKLASATGQLIWQPVWQAFETDQIMNNPPAITVCGETMYAFYPSISNQNNWLFYNTCNTSTLDWSAQLTLTFQDSAVPGGLAAIPTATGVGAATFNGEVYVFWQGVGTSGTGSPNGTLFYRTMSNANYHQINAQQVVEGHGAGAVMTNCPAAVTFNNELYVFYEGPAGDDWMWYTHSSDGSSWSASQQVPATGMTCSPSPVIFPNPSTGEQQLYVFHQGWQDTGQLWFNVLDTNGNWVGDKQVPNVAMSATPSAGVYDGTLYVLYQGGDTSTFWYVYSSDGSTWSEPYRVADLRVSYTPSIVEFNSMLYIVMQGPENDKILWYSTFTPGASSTAVIPMTAFPSNANSTERGPVLFTYEGSLYCYTESASSSPAMLISELNESGWGEQTEVVPPGAQTTPTSVVVCGQYSYTFNASSDMGNNLFFAQTSNPTVFPYNQLGVAVPGATTTCVASPVMFNDELYVFYQTPATRMPCNLAYNILSAPNTPLNVENPTSGWSGSQLVPLNTVWDSQPEGVAPAAVVFNEDLYVFYLGNWENSPSDEEYFVCYYRLDSSKQWSGQYNFPSIGYSTQNAGNFSPGPAVTPFVYNNELFLVYQNGSGYLYYVSSANGTSWAQPKQLSYQVPQSTPPFDGSMLDWTINLGFFLAG